MQLARIWSSDGVTRDADRRAPPPRRRRLELARRGASSAAAAVLVFITAVAGAVELPGELLRPPCVGCQQPADSAQGLFSAADWKRLRDGKVVVVDRSDAGGEGAAPKESEAAVIIPRPPSEVWAVLVDFESRPRIWPEVSESRLERVEDNRAWIRQSVKILWTQIRYTLTTTLDPARGVMTFALDRSAPHDIRDSSGSWQILPDGDGAALLLSRDRVDPGTPLPAMIERYLVGKSLPAMMSNLRQEVERRADPSAGPLYH
jgi:hypothetical protein